MALAPARPLSALPTERTFAPNRPVADDQFSPHEFLVAALLDQSTADVGWLAWHAENDAVVMTRTLDHTVDATTIGEFPEPPSTPVHVGAGSGDDPWSTWCRVRGIQSCMVVPIRGRTRAVGSVGLASWIPGTQLDADVPRLELVAALSIRGRQDERRLADLRRLFDEVSRTLENALSLDRALRLPPSYRELARSIGESLDVTYCQIAIRDTHDSLTIRASGGHRGPRRGRSVALPLGELNHCQQALRTRRAVVLNFNGRESASEHERLALFSPTTRCGVILPFVAGPRSQGVLIIGEERVSRYQRLTPERIAILELVASRVAHIMRMSRRLEYERLAERRRQRKLRLERQRIAREVHDEVGQSLTGLLVHVRHALSQGHAGRDDLEIMEQAAKSAMNGARALAYDFRTVERGIGALERARSYADVLLRSARCNLKWVEERADATAGPKTLIEISRVIKEAVNNIVRHAQAVNVRIRVQYPEGRIRVTVRDDGVGFLVDDVRPTSDGRGLGLAGSSERLARVGGAFRVVSSPGKGTVVVMEAPRTVKPGSAKG